MIQLTNLHKAFGSQNVLNGLSLTVPPGSSVQRANSSVGSAARGSATPSTAWERYWNARVKVKTRS